MAEENMKINWLATHTIQVSSPLPPHSLFLVSIRERINIGGHATCQASYPWVMKRERNHRFASWLARVRYHLSFLLWVTVSSKTEGPSRGPGQWHEGYLWPDSCLSMAAAAPTQSFPFHPFIPLPHPTKELFTNTIDAWHAKTNFAWWLMLGCRKEHLLSRNGQVVSKGLKSSTFILVRKEKGWDNYSNDVWIWSISSSKWQLGQTQEHSDTATGYIFQWHFAIPKFYKVHFPQLMQPWSTSYGEGQGRGMTWTHSLQVLGNICPSQ